ncbi:MAG: hypothetical protein EOO08_01690 [Chitinophagaceae bacterium]|nr:MAG: hypothetical protein EOO08_01690 [Chitinophagaceae bacterium]
MRGLLFLFLLLSLVSRAQNAGVSPVRNTPSSEVYDLLQDRNGHIWVAHNAGLSRYDGRNFVNYGTPLQNGRAVTDLCEDRHGRIWCHNFEGQIFYVEGQRQQLLRGYDFRQERFFPRIAIYGDELVATSVRGFFTCNTSSLESRLYPITETTSLTVLPQGVLLLSPGYGFFLYEKGKTIRKLKTKVSIKRAQNHALQPEAMGDTAHMLVNPEGAVYRLLVRGDSLVVTDRIEMRSYVNSVTVDGNDWWIHTNALSVSGRGRRIENQFLSNVLSDVQGHSYWSSVKFGLLAGFRTRAVPVQVPFLESGDYVRTLQRIRPGSYLVGTHLGRLYWTRGGRVHSETRLTSGSGAIEHVWPMGDSLYLVAGSLGLYTYDLRWPRLDVVDTNLVAKDCTTGGGRVVLATTYGVISTTVPYLRGADSLRDIVPTGSNLRRCRSVCLDPKGLLYVAVNKGFFSWSPTDSSALTYESAPLFATRIRNFAGAVLVTTFNRGLFVKKPASKLESLSLLLAQQPNAAPDLKVDGNTAWVLYDDVIQQLDTGFRAQELSDLPFRGADVSDLIEEDSSLLAATSNGLFRLPKMGAGTVPTRSIFDFVRVNESINALGVHTFNHNQNSVTIGLSTPWFTSTDHLRYRYRLCSNDRCNWMLSEQGQSSFSFIDLPPGDYRFSAIAVNANGNSLAPEVSYAFTIRPPWWQTWWAQLLCLVAVTALFFLLGLYLQKQRSRRERTRYEKMLAVEHERQRISAEIHDDLGATLSGVRLLTELAREKMPPGPLRADIEKIHESITSLTEKTREVIWTLNTDQDTLESLLLYLQKQAQHLFEGSTIQLQVQLPVEIPVIRISGDIRRNVYLAVKEALHNCLKHSGASWCRLLMECREHLVEISVQDDGNGMASTSAGKSFSNGMRSMQQRMDHSGGTLRIGSGASGTCLTFLIPLNNSQ